MLEMIPLSLLAIAAGGALGGVARFVVTTTVDQWHQSVLPVGTFVVNGSGAFLLGLFAGSYAAATPMASLDPLWLFAVAGVFGSYTTVSSFSLQAISLLYARQHQAGLITIAATIIGGIGLAAVGYFAGSLAIAT